MKRAILSVCIAAVALTGCAVSYSARPTDEKRKPDCVQLQRREGNQSQSVGLYCRTPATTIK